jgi:hypothetical protein
MSHSSEEAHLLIIKLRQINVAPTSIGTKSLAPAAPFCTFQRIISSPSVVRIKYEESYQTGKMTP